MSARLTGAERKPLDVPTIPLSGVHLIEASAGTGKTFTITSLILRMLVEEARPLESILAVTFTNAATAELKERVLERIQTAREALAEPLAPDADPVLVRLASLPDQKRVLRLLDAAAQSADRAAIFTIHGFAARLLRDHAFESGSREDTELIGDQRALVQDVVTDFWSSRVATLPQASFELIGGSGFFRVLTRVGLAAAAAFEVPLVPLGATDDLQKRQQELSEVYERAQAEFEKSGEAVRKVLLNSTAIKRNILIPASLQADYDHYKRYFARGEPTLGHPKGERWTQRKVSSAIRKNQPQVEHPLLVVLEELCDGNARCQAAARDFADGLREELCQLVHARVKEEHERAGTQSFDGLLTDLHLALRDGERGPLLAAEVRAKMPVALIDEFQDTDPIQYEIFRKIYDPSDSGRGADETALYLIGDPKQSIYAFRGADVRTYLHAASHAKGGVWTLDTSYRASPALVAAQNALFSFPRDTFCVPNIQYQSVRPRPGAKNELFDSRGTPLPGMRLLFSSDKDEKSCLLRAAQEVARLLHEGCQLKGEKVTPQDIAVLTRTNRQAQQVQAHLRALGIPAVMHGDRSVFEAPEALELRRVLRALSEPGHRVLTRTALSTRLLGLCAEELARLDCDHELLETWISRLRHYGDLWRAKGIAHAMEALSAETDLVRRTLMDRDGERRMTNFRHLLELLHEAQASEHLGVQGLLRSLEGAIADPSGHAMAAEARQLRLESDANAVTLTTAHKSKGLEYPIVFLPSLGLDERGFGDEAFRYFDPEKETSLFEMRAKESRAESEEIHTLEQRQESLRLAYVALTRAQHHVVALCGVGDSFSALAYLLHEREAGEPSGIDSLCSRLKKKVPADVKYEEIRSLCRLSEGAISVEPLSEDLGPVFARPVGEEVLLPPPAPPQLSESEKTSSFSGMTRQEHGLSRAAQEGRDVDDVAAPDGAEEEDLVAGGAQPTPQGGPTESTVLERSVLADFPRGPRPGDALHAVFEFSPFAEGTPEERAQVAQRELEKRGFSGEDVHAAALCLEDVLKTPLDFGEGHGLAPGFSLGDLTPVHRAPEMEFSLPVGRPDKRLSAERLARALGAPDLAANAPPVRVPADAMAAPLLSYSYLETIRRLPFSAWSGFLRGFMDLVFLREEKIFGLDYKSNYLGADYVDYGQAALQSCMEEHHYLLQALLYAVAIHRYARTRIPAYSYETHFGGMYYLFLRGMHPSRPGGGVYFFRPEKTLVQRISDLFGEES